MATLKQLKKALKKAGLKTSGSKRALTRRAKKAHVMRGGDKKSDEAAAKEAKRLADAKKALEDDERRRRAETRADKAAVEELRKNEPPKENVAADRAELDRRPGGTRVKRPVKKHSTKKRSSRHLTASAYRW